MLLRVPVFVLALAIVALAFAPVATAGDSRTQSVVVAAPSPLDFTLATVQLDRAARELRASVLGSPADYYIAIVAVGARPLQPVIAPPPLSLRTGARTQRLRAVRELLVLIVDRQPPSTRVDLPARVVLRIRTRQAEPPAIVSQSVDVLAHGASGQDCSRIKARGRPPVGSDLEAELMLVTHPRGEPFWISSPVESIARALDRACGVAIDSQFTRWIRREPPIPHP